MRMTRLQWLLSQATRTPPARPWGRRRDRKEPKTFLVLGCRARFRVRAHTKSEGRAEAKRVLGIPRKARLPVGMELAERPARAA